MLWHVLSLLVSQNQREPLFSEVLDLFLQVGDVHLSVLSLYRRFPGGFPHLRPPAPPHTLPLGKKLK